MIDFKELQQAIEKADKLFRPYAIIFNPKYKREINDNFGKSFIVYASDFVPSEQVYVVNRKTFNDIEGSAQEHFFTDCPLPTYEEEDEPHGS